MAWKLASFDDSCWTEKGSLPPVDGALAPGPPEAFEPKTTSQLEPLASDIPLTRIVVPETETLPPLHVVVVKPAAVPVTEGVDQSAGTPIVRPPLAIVRVALYWNV